MSSPATRWSRPASVRVIAQVAALTAWLVASAAAQDQAPPQQVQRGVSPPATSAGTKHFFNSYLGKVPPELQAQPAHWVNHEPLTLEKLRGKTVWLEFNF